MPCQVWRVIGEHLWYETLKSNSGKTLPKMTKHFRSAALSPKLFAPQNRIILALVFPISPRKKKDFLIGRPVSLGLIELPWSNPAPLALTSSLRGLAVLLPHLSDSTQCSPTGVMEAPLTIAVLPVETKVVTHSHGRKCQNLRFQLCLHGQAVVEEGLIQLEQSRQNCSLPGLSSHSGPGKISTLRMAQNSQLANVLHPMV